MNSNLESLVKIGKLKAEPPAQPEFDGLVSSGRKRLADARNASLSTESRFDLAYNAAHALSLAALRWNGYRSGNRYIVFQALAHTLGMKDSEWRLLSLCHDRRNAIEYDGSSNIDDKLVAELIEVAARVLDAAGRLGPVAKA